MRKPAALAHGWGISLLFRGRNVAECSVRDGLPVQVGEDPACTVVLPGLGDRVPLVRGDQLLHVPGLTGSVRRNSADEPEPLAAAVSLAPGERAELRLREHPEITLELRRQTFERLPLATLVNLRELGRQLALGAGLIAGMILLVRSEKPVNTLEIKGEPDADADDSPLVRAMFATTVEPPPPSIDLRFLPAPAPVAPPPAGPLAALPEPAQELVATAPPPVAVPVPDAPLRARKRRGGGETDELYNALGTLDVATISDASNYALIGALEGGVAGGVVGGVLDSKQAFDVLADLNPDAPGLAIGGGGTGEGIAAIGSVISPPVVTLDSAPAPEVIKEVVDLDASFVEAPMGPGASDPPVLKDSPPSPPPPPPPGVHSHPQAGVAVARGSLDGLAAVAPAADCDDPTLSKKRQLDVVFVVDVSTTMGFLLDRLEKQLAQVDREARAQGLDTRYGLVVFVDDVLLANQGQPFADLAAVQAELAHWQAFTASNRQINSTTANVDWPENSLDALHTAATGFAWRPADTTLRMVVHATDDDFGEAPAVQSGLAVQHTYLEAVAALRAAEVRMFSFAAKIGGQCECLDVRPGLFTRHRGRASLPDATGGAVFDIDEVASGKLGFAAAVAGAIKSGVCTRYPLSPFGKSPPAAAAPSPGQ